MKKRLISAVMVIAMLFSFVSCAVDPTVFSDDTTDGVSDSTETDAINNSGIIRGVI